MDDRLWPRASAWLADGADPTAKVGVVGIPSSIASLSPSGARTAPAALREALRGFATFHSDRSIDLAPLTIYDHGDLTIDDSSMSSSQADIENGIAALPRNEILAIVGGDNAITRPAVKALAGDLARVGVVTLDAHHDVRLLDDGPSNGTPIRGLIEDGLPGLNIVQIGIHSFANSHAYRSYCEENGITTLTAAAVEEQGSAATAATALARLAHCEWIYVDFDIDVLDRAFAPGCPGARPGGLTPRQLGDLAYHMGVHSLVRAADFVEVDPARDRDNLTLHAMAHTFLSFLTGITQRKEIQ